MNTDELALEEEFARASLKRATWGRLIGYFRPHRRTLLLVLLLEATWVSSMLLDPHLIKVALNGPLPAGDVAGTFALVGWICLNVVVRAILTRWELRMSTWIGVQIQDAIRRDVFDHVQRLSMRYFDRTKQGRIIARADRDVDTLEHLIFWGPILVTMMLLSLSLGTIWLFVVNAKLAVWVVAALPLVWLTTRIFHRLGFPPTAGSGRRARRSRPTWPRRSPACVWSRRSTPSAGRRTSSRCARAATAKP